MVAPYYPPALATAVVNPKVGGYVKPIAYLSNSQYRFAPTAMNTNDLVPMSQFAESNQQAQDEALTGVLQRMSGWVDRYLFGAASAAKGASLCASQTVADGTFLPLRGYLKLQCDYKPILQLDACAIGMNPATVQAIPETLAQQAIFDIRTIKIPVQGLSAGATTTPTFNSIPYGPDGRVYAVWTYTSGYPHLALAANAAQGQPVVQVIPNGPSGTLLGIYPGTPMTIYDTAFTEDLVVQSVSGTNITFTSNLRSAHAIPLAPDFIPVSSIPGDVLQAAIFLATAFIKSRGDYSLTLDGINEPKDVKTVAFAIESDVSYACKLLEPFRVVTKQRS
jgi:hypothetical protein